MSATQVVRIRLEPDKTVFIDTLAPSHSDPVHSVEISDGRSRSHFVTFYCKGKDRLVADTLHDTEVYHRERPIRWWLKKAWELDRLDTSEGKGWNAHCHIELDHPPRWEDFHEYAAQIPQCLLEEIGRYFDDPESTVGVAGEGAGGLDRDAGVLP